MHIYEACPEVENERFLLHLPHINDRLYDQRGSMAALARSAMASPGGKLSSEARLMRNGEIDQFYMQFVEKVQFERLYILI